MRTCWNEATMSVDIRGVTFTHKSFNDFISLEIFLSFSLIVIAGTTTMANALSPVLTPL